MPQTVCQSYPSRSFGALVGYVLLAAGIILLFICIPGWVWFALAGVLLIAAGWLVLRFCSAWR